MKKAKIQIVEDGPYLVSGPIKLSQAIMKTVGHHREYTPGKDLPQAQSYALCRCGKSQNMPFCDGQHVKEGFEGSEVASTAPFDERAQVFPGATLDLYDDGRCAYARFCHREQGDVWTLTKNSQSKEIREEAIEAASSCPTGRLVQHDKEDNYRALEPEYPEPEIVLLEDPEKECSGPLFVKGGILLESAKGFTYENRNRYTLCRCGESRNKPFCDAIHVNLAFDDGL